MNCGNRLKSSHRRHRPLAVRRIPLLEHLTEAWRATVHDQVDDELDNPLDALSISTLPKVQA